MNLGAIDIDSFNEAARNSTPLCRNNPSSYRENYDNDYEETAMNSKITIDNPHRHVIYE
jgi:hypothetical protein